MGGGSHQRSRLVGRQNSPKSYVNLPILAKRNPVFVTVTSSPQVGRPTNSYANRELASPHFSHAKICFQSFFMLITVQPFLFASSYNA